MTMAYGSGIVVMFDMRIRNLETKKNLEMQIRSSQIGGFGAQNPRVCVHHFQMSRKIQELSPAKPRRR